MQNNQDWQYVCSHMSPPLACLLTYEDQTKPATPETRLARLVVRQELQEQTRWRITPEISSQTAALGEIAFKWTIIKTLLMLQVLSGFSETNHTKWFLVPFVKNFLEKSKFQFCKNNYQRERKISGALEDWEREGTEKCPCYPVPWLTLADFCLWPSDIISSFITSYNSLCRNYLSLDIWVI